MDISGMVVSSCISILIEKLAPGAVSLLLPFGGIIDENQKKVWRETLMRLEAVLPKAEQRYISNEVEEASALQWVFGVQKVVSEIDNFMDGLVIEARRRQVIDESETSGPRKLFKFVSGFFSTLSCTYSQNRKISDINNSLQDLVKRMNDLKLDDWKFNRKMDMRLQSTHLVDSNLVCGRQEEIDEILTLLLDDRKSNNLGVKMHVISIVGMPGIGKTTIAQCLFNNRRVRDRFRCRVWVCAPGDLDILNTSTEIYEEVFEKTCPFTKLNMVQRELVNKLSEGNFLLVLDDVCTADHAKWHYLCAPFRASPFESIIIVTTRSHLVAKAVRSKEVYDVKALSDGDCLSIIAHHALERPNFDEHKDLLEVGEVIAKRCKGLPLAATSLGCLLCNEEIPNQWITISSEKVWDQLSNDIKSDICRSYHHLPFHLKPLFLYCSIFPNGYEFDKQELLMLWMAQGFLSPSGVETQIDELGCKYFSELLSRSFFQSLTGESNFIMHDLTSDLAQFVAGVTYFRSEDEPESDEEYKVPTEARHASFGYSRYLCAKKFKALKKVPGLRTFLIIQDKTGLSYLSSAIFWDLLPKLKVLRTLSIGGCRISEVPKSLAALKHLRYLDLSRTDISELPDFVSHLYSLETLLLHGCSKLICLPKNIRNLIYLRHLNIVDTPRLKEMPSGIGALTLLHTLPKFIVDNSYGRKITELKGLHHLKGTLFISGLENVMSVQDAIEANLMGKKGLQGLELKWSSSSNGSIQRAQLEFKILEAIKPTVHLKSLEIENYRGHTFPTWIGDRLFDRMVKVRLNGCNYIKKLPPLEEMTSLKELFIEGMDGVKKVTHAKGFPSLTILSFKNMNGLKEWLANVDGAFPCLQELHMCGCSRLKTVSLPSIPSLGTLKLHDFNQMVLPSMADVLGSVKKLELHNILGLNVLNEEVIRCLGEVQDVSVDRCEQLSHLWQEEVACNALKKIKSLTVKGCQQLQSLGVKEQVVLPHSLEILELENCGNLEKMPNWQNSHISLRRLAIKECKNLQNLPSTTHLQPNIGEYEFSNLEAVSVRGCPALQSFPTGKKLPRTLRDLSVGDCENMEEPEEGETGMSSRESITFDSWSNMKNLPEGFTHVTRLVINGCQGIESIPERSLSPTLVSLVITNCSNLKEILCHNEMKKLESLRELTIVGCANLESYPIGECWPPKLESLTMGDVKQPIERWGLEKLPVSLVTLGLNGEFPELVSLLLVVQSLLPTSTTSSLSSLQVKSLKNLKSLSKGLESLSSLKHLVLVNCPMLLKLPEYLLPTLSSLEIEGCPGLKEKCKKGKRNYWPKISRIPCFKMDGELVWGL